MSQLEVDKIIPQSGTTLTIGDSGDTITISAGATLSGSLNADNLDSGTVPDARITGAYTGITNLTMSGDLTVDTNTLKVDSANNRVGIGTSSPEEKLDLGAGQPQNLRAGLRTYLGAGHSTAATILGHTVKARDSSTDGSGAMETTETNSGGGAPSAIRMHNGNIEFHTASSGTANAVFDSERMRIYETGAVLLGTTTVGSAGAGDLSVNGGIFLGGTGTANKLDDYEEGTWSPAISGTTGGASGVAFGDRFGSYTKIGNQVTVHVYINLDSWSSGPSGSLTIATLPFTSSSTSTYRSAVSIGFTENFATAAPSGGTITSNDTKIIFRKYNGTSALENMNTTVPTSNASGDEIIILTATYEAA